MFWRRERTVRVELVNPEIRVQAEQRCDPKPEAPRAEPPSPPPSADADFTLKLIALLAVSVQGGLAIYGYNVLAGSYEPYGIVMSELEIGLQSLLFYGYVYLFMDTFVPVSQIPVFGSWIAALTFTAIAGCFVWRLKPTSTFEEKLSRTGILGFLLFLIFVVPMMGIARGQALSLEDIAKSGLPASASRLSRTHVIPTDEGKKQGMVVAATAKYTFLLVGTEVFKFDNDGNKVVRITKLSAKDELVETAKQ